MNITDLIGKHMDCWSLAHEVYNRVGKHLPAKYLSIFADKSPEEINEIILGHKKLFKRLDGPKPFALVAFYATPPLVSHIGVVDETGTKVIHATKKFGVVVTPISMLRLVEGYYEWINS